MTPRKKQKAAPAQDGIVRIPLLVQWLKRDITKGQADPRRVVTALEMRATASGAVDLEALARTLEDCEMMACLFIVPPGEMARVLKFGRRA